LIYAGGSASDRWAELYMQSREGRSRRRNGICRGADERGAIHDTWVLYAGLLCLFTATPQCRAYRDVLEMCKIWTFGPAAVHAPQRSEHRRRGSGEVPRIVPCDLDRPIRSTPRSHRSSLVRLYVPAVLAACDP